MQVIENNDVKIYNVTGGRALPEWISNKTSKKLKSNDDEQKRRVDLLHGFDMPDITDAVEVSPNGQYILTTGTYKPRIRCYDVKELSIKFDRCIDHSAHKVKFISDDISKFAVLRSDRYVEFHTLSKLYHVLRIPSYGRDMIYDKTTCEINVVGLGNQVYRFNLYAGQFLKPFTAANVGGYNCCDINQHMQILGCGSEKGTVSCFDIKNETFVNSLNVAQYEKSFKKNCEVTAVQFDGLMNLAVGTSNGTVYVYDIRNNKPFAQRDHVYEDPIKKIIFKKSKNMDENVVLSADKHCVKIWSLQTSDLYTTIEAEKNINDFSVYQDSGLLLFANEAPKGEIYFVPALDPAPGWCTFLDSLTEELEESRHYQMYDDYYFITPEELEELNLSHLKGTNKLKPILHGYYIDRTIYKKTKSLSAPMNYELHKKEQAKLKLQREREERIKLFKLPTVNTDLAVSFLSKKKKITQTDLENPINDARFSSLFADPDFEVDEEADEYRLIKSIVGKRKLLKKRNQTTEDHDVKLLDKLDIGENMNHHDDAEFAADHSHFKYKISKINDPFNLSLIDDNQTLEKRTLNNNL